MMGRRQYDGRVVVVCMWLMGVLNNSIFVITNAGAKEILSSGVGLIYFCNTFPTLVIQGCGPYWYHLVSYERRILICGLLGALSVTLIGLSEMTVMRLVGVMVGSFAQGLGESTILGLLSFYQGKEITAWSSGTGFAGIFGYFWYALFRHWIALSFRWTMILANILPLLYVSVYRYALTEKPRGNYERLVQHHASDEEDEHGTANDMDNAEEGEDVQLTARDKINLFKSLWRFTIPLILVYVTEYSMQSGTWAAIGFPVHDKSARDKFYLYSNWLYQVGVFVSRSSGNLINMSLTGLWVMPLIQTCLLVFFILDPLYHLWWHQSVLVMCFVVGLLGGSCYVHCFIIMQKTVKKRYLEFSLSAVAVAATIGTALSNIFGLIIQGCLYGAQDIREDEPPTFTCGYDY